MCGICGALRVSPTAPPVDREELLRTREAMASRGPDGAGAWFADDGTVGLGHRRLAILDLSDSGAQPMASPDGRYRIVFNGEIYNFRELRSELIEKGHRFRSESDTEVILTLFARDGPRSFARLRGMYALALWDSRERALTLARDPYGIKPLYYSLEDGVLRFASQVKALEAGGRISRGVDPAGLVGFLLWGSVPEPRTIRDGMRAIPAGHWLRVGEEGVGDPLAFDRIARREPSDRSEDLREAIERTVRYHLVSDVPVAVFLSAGLDSGMIAAVARRVAPEPPTTITLRFEEFRGTDHDEAPLAARVAAVLGTRHLERTVRAGDFLDLWSHALAAMDQPSIDGFNTYVVSRVAREAGFKVVLSGLGGDEIFGSYDSFSDVPRWTRTARRFSRAPGLPAAWPAFARLVPTKPKLRAFLARGGSLTGAYWLRRGLFLPDEIRGLLPADLAEEGLRKLEAEPPLESALRAAGAEIESLDADPWRAVHLMESVQYMRNQLLRDADWAAMAHSLELRVPLVDAFFRRDIEALDFEPGRSRGKSAAVRTVAPELPEEVFARPKSGFTIPVMRWLSAEPARGLGTDSRRLALRVLDSFDAPLDERGRRAVAS